MMPLSVRNAVRLAVLDKLACNERLSAEERDAIDWTVRLIKATERFGATVPMSRHLVPLPSYLGDAKRRAAHELGMVALRDNLLTFDVRDYGDRQGYELQARAVLLRPLKGEDDV